MEESGQMIREHHIKIDKEYADSVACGDKTFEVRFNDRSYQKGDKIIFKVIDDMGLSVDHPLNDRRYEITYVLSGVGIKEGWVAFSIKEENE